MNRPGLPSDRLAISFFLAPGASYPPGFFVASLPRCQPHLRYRQTHHRSYGGVSPGGERWIACKPGFFLPVRVLSRPFRRLFLEHLDRAYGKGKLRLSGQLGHLKVPSTWDRSVQSLADSEWVVYAKPPFVGPHQVIEYLGRYIHRVAISNQRIVRIANGQVTFRWKDYRRRNKQKTRIMVLDSDEFIRRFLMHVLPSGFQRIRHFGFFANCHRKRRLPLVLRLLSSPVVELLPDRLRCREMFHDLPPALSPWTCRQCGSDSIRPIEILPVYRWPAKPPDSS